MHYRHGPSYAPERGEFHAGVYTPDAIVISAIAIGGAGHGGRFIEYRFRRAGFDASFKMIYVGESTLIFWELCLLGTNSDWLVSNRMLHFFRARLSAYEQLSRARNWRHTGKPATTPNIEFRDRYRNRHCGWAMIIDWWLQPLGSWKYSFHFTPLPDLLRRSWGFIWPAYQDMLLFPWAIFRCLIEWGCFWLRFQLLLVSFYFSDDYRHVLSLPLDTYR